VQAELTALFTERLNAEVPSETTDLFETGILDSQTFVELLLHIEQKFNTQILIDQFEIENFRSIDRIANLILQQNKFGKLIASLPDWRNGSTSEKENTTALQRRVRYHFS